MRCTKMFYISMKPRSRGPDTYENELNVPIATLTDGPVIKPNTDSDYCD